MEQLHLHKRATHRWSAALLSSVFLLVIFIAYSPVAASVRDLDEYGEDALRPEMESISVVARAVEEVNRRLMEAREAYVLAVEEKGDFKKYEAIIPLYEEVLAQHKRELRAMVDAVKLRDGELPVWLKGTLALVMDEKEAVGDPKFFTRKKRRSLKQELAHSLKQSEVGSWLSLGESGEDVVVYLELPVIFSSGSASVSKEYQTTLRRVASTLKAFEPVVEVTGVTDAGKSTKGFHLSTERAANVAREFLLAGLDSDAFSIQTRTEAAAMDRVEVRFRIHAG